MLALKGILETSFVDWPGRVCAVLFIGGCNFRCPFCHNHALVTAPEAFPTLAIDDVRNRLLQLKPWLGGVCVTGGEPTLDPELPAFLRRLKKDGWAVKLDTNGSRPATLAQLLDNGLVDMVAMDVKAPLNEQAYRRCTGKKVDLESIRTSINLICESPVANQFRMTVLPSLHSEASIRAWAEYFPETANLKLQNFNPRTTLAPGLSKEQPFPPDTFETFCKICSNSNPHPLTPCPNF